MRSPSAVAVEIVEIARRERSVLMAELTSRMSQPLSCEALCERMSGAMTHYAQALMGAVTDCLDRLSAGDREWIRVEYLTWMFEFATAACTLTSDPAARHEVAQALQCAIFSEERRLRAVLEGAAPARLAADCRKA